MMKVTRQNFDTIEDRSNLLEALLDELDKINSKLKPENQIELWYETEHTEYSPERTDPCPDFYHTYSLFSKKLDCTLAEEMGIHELDNVLCALSLFLELI